MKRLLFLRHAQTLPAEGASDVDRKLTPNGQADARALGATMKDKNYQPDTVLCSPALRTKETLELVMESLEGRPVETVPAIYSGTRGDLFHLVQNINDKTDTVLIVGHNPTIHEFIATLAREGSPTLMNRLASGYVPGTLGVLECPCASWKNIQPGENPLVDLMAPIDYNAPATPARWT